MTSLDLSQFRLSFRVESSTTVFCLPILRHLDSNELPLQKQDGSRCRALVCQVEERKGKKTSEAEIYVCKYAIYV